MPYDERSINELYESAEITPMGIQLEVNAEIFTTIYNLLSNMRSEEGIQQEDENAFSIYGGKRFAPWPRWNSAKVMGFLWKTD